MRIRVRSKDGVRGLGLGVRREADWGLTSTVFTYAEFCEVQTGFAIVKQKPS